jgi:transcriptional regulator with XRE-family HTH domain
MTSSGHSKERKELGEKLRHARETAKLTQAQVAEVSGMHVNYYARIERGEENPSFEKLQDIKKVFKIKSLKLL